MWFFSKKNESGCEICQSEKASKHLVYKIIKTSNFPFELGKSPDFGGAQGGFDMAFSDVNQSHPQGTIYFYKMATANSVHMFCSLKCAFEFSVKTNSFVGYPDPIIKGKTRGITPDILKINQSLGASEELKYRGQPAGNF